MFPPVSNYREHLPRLLPLICTYGPSRINRNVKLYHSVGGTLPEDGWKKKPSLTRTVKNAPIGRLLVKDYRLLLPNTKFQPMMAIGQPA